MKEHRITNIRAIAILIVMFGHSIIMYSSSWSLHIEDISYPILDYTKKLINLLQMPLFFSISGYLFYYSAHKCKSLWCFVKNKTKRLLVPYFSIALLWMIPIKKVVEYPNYIGKRVDYIVVEGIIFGRDSGHLWYLPTLFIILVVFCSLFIILKKHREKQMFVNCGLLLIIGIYFLSNKLKVLGIPYASTVASNFIWVYLGYFINYIEHSKVSIKKYYKTIIFATTIIISAIAIIKINSLLSVLAGMGWVAVFYWSIPDKRYKTLEFLSENSFGIYLFHSPLIYVTLRCFSDFSPIFVVMINFVVFGGVAIVMTLLVRKIKCGRIIGEYF